MITTVSPKKDGQWLAQVLEGLRCAGVAVINDVLAPSVGSLTDHRITAGPNERVHP